MNSHSIPSSDIGFYFQLSHKWLGFFFLSLLETDPDKTPTLELAAIPLCIRAGSLQSCLTLCNPLDYSLPGSYVHGILQARILEWVAMPSSRGSSLPRDRTHISYVSYIARRLLYCYCHLGDPFNISYDCFQICSYFKIKNLKGSTCWNS